MKMIESWGAISTKPLTWFEVQYTNPETKNTHHGYFKRRVSAEHYKAHLKEKGFVKISCRKVMAPPFVEEKVDQASKICTKNTLVATAGVEDAS